MAELDDFFAKKDKKKSKKATKFVTADELVKSLEDGSKREVVKPKKPEPVAGGVAVVGENENSGGTNVPESAPPVEEEWKEFEEEQRKDYSGLKIGQLSTISSAHSRTAQESEEARAARVPSSAPDGGSYDDDDEDSNGYDNADPSKERVGHGPWKKVIPAEEVMQIPVPVEVEKPSSKTYVSPALRYSQAGSGLGGGSIGGAMRPRRAAPDITNTEFFPTLSAARPEEQRKKKNEPAFEEVRHGGRFQRVQESTTAPVAASNRFQSLDDEAS
ncbi:protein CDV3 homolog isoform X2 [Drosophila gunungcola]|uniref:protein CDV3 homolog isoform X2 n=1 Tax=Drosophila gunungcola TaxID=103775 RepID=UPI0022E2DCBD|nr:protein CDV3 homolog isoform X2 [Drosophila gunungcola]